MRYREVDRPKRNRRKLGDPTLGWDHDMQTAVLTTLETRRAVVFDLCDFHSSPMKGRLWTMGYRLHHRVMPDRRTVAAWIEPVPALETAA